MKFLSQNCSAYFLTVTIPYFLQLLLSYRRIVTGICTDSKEIIKKSLKIFKKT